MAYHLMAGTVRENIKHLGPGYQAELRDIRDRMLGLKGPALQLGELPAFHRKWSGLGAGADPQMPPPGAPVNERRCRDCGDRIEDPLRSEPSRCRPCGSAHRRMQNARYRGR